MEQLTMLPYVQATDNALVVAFVTNLENGTSPRVRNLSEDVSDLNMILYCLAVINILHARKSMKEIFYSNESNVSN